MTWLVRIVAASGVLVILAIFLAVSVVVYPVAFVFAWTTGKLGLRS